MLSIPGRPVGSTKTVKSSPASALTTSKPSWISSSEFTLPLSSLQPKGPHSTTLMLIVTETRGSAYKLDPAWGRRVPRETSGWVMRADSSRSHSFI